MLAAADMCSPRSKFGYKKSGVSSLTSSTESDNRASTSSWKKLGGGGVGTLAESLNPDKTIVHHSVY